MNVLNIPKTALIIYGAIALALTVYLTFFQEFNDAIPLDVKILVDEYKAKPLQEIPDGEYSGYIHFQGELFKVTYLFSESSVTKTVLQGYGKEEPIIKHATTSYEIEGSIIQFKEEPNGIFITTPRPFEIYEDKLRFLGSLEMRDFFKEKS